MGAGHGGSEGAEEPRSGLPLSTQPLLDTQRGWQAGWIPENSCRQVNLWLTPHFTGHSVKESPGGQMQMSIPV